MQDALVKTFAGGAPGSSWTPPRRTCAARSSRCTWTAGAGAGGGRPGGTSPRDRVRRGAGAGTGDRIDLVAALRGLPPQQRACVVLRFYEDLTVAEIAHHLAVSDGAVKRYLSLGVHRLEGLLGRSRPPPRPSHSCRRDEHGPRPGPGPARRRERGTAQRPAIDAAPVMDGSAADGRSGTRWRARSASRPRCVAVGAAQGGTCAASPRCRRWPRHPPGRRRARPPSRRRRRRRRSGRVTLVGTSAAGCRSRTSSTRPGMPSCGSSRWSRSGTPRRGAGAGRGTGRGAVRAQLSWSPSLVNGTDRGSGCRCRRPDGVWFVADGEVVGTLAWDPGGRRPLHAGGRRAGRRGAAERDAGRVRAGRAGDRSAAGRRLRALCGAGPAEAEARRPGHRRARTVRVARRRTGCHTHTPTTAARGRPAPGPRRARPLARPGWDRSPSGSRPPPTRAPR